MTFHKISNFVLGKKKTRQVYNMTLPRRGYKEFIRSFLFIIIHFICMIMNYYVCYSVKTRASCNAKLMFKSATPGGDYRILCVSERFLSLILLGGEILRAAAEITCLQSWDYRLRSQKEQLLGKAECLANCSLCGELDWHLLFAGYSA